MNEWSLVGEYFALIILLVIALFMYGTKPQQGYRRRRICYHAALLLSASSILLNICDVAIIENMQNFSVPIAMGVTTAYFIVTWIMVTVLVFYLIQRVLEFVYDTRHINLVRVILTVVMVCFGLLAFHNLFGGELFYFNAREVYCRGPLNSAAYALPIIDVMVLMTCYVLHHKSVSAATRRVLFVAAPISLLMIVYQMANPEHLLNGAISSLACLIIFVGYRVGHEEQDYVTGLDNRNYYLNEILFRTEGRQPYQAVMIKLRRLSRIAQVYGQAGYNTVLFQTAEALRREFPEAMAFRYSEERFTLVFDDASEVECNARLQKVAELLAEPHKLGTNEGSLMYYVVDFRYNGQPWSPESINGYVGSAIQVAIAEETPVVAFDERRFLDYQRRDYVLDSMRTALSDGLFEVWYQPIYHCGTQGFESAEALVRMTDGHGCYISPAEFIPVAEETGMISEIATYVLREICQLLASGEIEELESVSINLPIRQFQDEGLRDRLQVVLDEYRIKPNQIKLEITERDVEENGAAAIEIIEMLAGEGYRFMLDDFGVAYSNLSRVLTLPLESIKIDRSIVMLLDARAGNHEAIEDHLFPFFKALGQYIVAEGVETQQLAEYMMHCGVDRIQGYYYAKPMPRDTLLEWYAARS